MIPRTTFTENTVDRLALLGAWLFALFIVCHPIFDYDLHWHLANGREMVQRGQIISEEIFSYTHFGDKFENHEWLAQIIFYLVWQTIGPYGLLGLKLLATSLVILLCFRTARVLGSQPWPAGLVCAFAVLAGYFRYTERPEMFSLLNLALISFILYSYRAAKISRKMLCLIPLILVAWNSLHGAVYGLVFLSVFVAGENIKHFFPALRREHSEGQNMLSTLNLCYAMAMLAMLIDPFGLRSYGEFLSILGSKASHASTTISEYAPVTWRREFMPFFILLAWAALLSVRHIRRIDLTQLILLFAFGAIAFKYSRAVAVASIVLVPIIASLLAINVRQAGSKLQQSLAPVILLVAAVFVAGYGYMLKFVYKSEFTLGYQLAEKPFPVGSARFVQEIGLDGNYYNSGHFGGYLAYFMTPERKIFQYNLGTVFGNSYRFITQPGELARWNINYAFVGTDDEVTAIFPKRQWARVYRDPEAVLVLRRTAQNQALIQQYELHFFHPLIQDDALHRMAMNAGILPRLAEEMGVHLAFLKDERIARLWAEILSANPDLRNQPRIQQLLHQALKYNSKLAQLAG